ncbi:hypothetical protein Cylst_0724 [Cylindrospermum stagnale PCC 7417]|uniref:Uncharacterized protein n=1 Tax=Cylindrospermum stagnale PCC 7417 TaxID=56107 RepID=K9WU47_9NOST|nr:hypothetical protein Cylst_0724 [Cylindrospermum stagnale PCC 7417]
MDCLSVSGFIHIIANDQEVNYYIYYLEDPPRLGGSELIFLMVIVLAKLQLQLIQNHAHING